MIADFITFLWASIYNLVTLLSGIVALVVDLVRRYFGWEVSNYWYIRIAAVCLMLGMFSAWREEHTEVKKKQDEINQLAQAGTPGDIARLSQDLDQMKQANKQLEDQIASLQKRQELWVLTEDQKRKLIGALSKSPPGVTYKLNIRVIPGCSHCAGYKNDLKELWGNVPGWEVQEATDYGLNPSLIGVKVVTDIEGCPPEELQFVMNALTAAELKYEQVLSKGKLQLESECVVLIGNRP